jgi:hypothetical protein
VVVAGGWPSLRNNKLIKLAFVQYSTSRGPGLTDTRVVHLKCNTYRCNCMRSAETGGGPLIRGTGGRDAEGRVGRP